MKTKKTILNRIIIFRTLMFCAAFILIAFSGKAQTIFGDQWVCVGESKLYKIINPQQGITYSWSITPAVLHSIFIQSNTDAIIQWGATPPTYPCTIEISDGSTTIASLNVWVYDNLNPFITTDNIVGCQANKFEDPYLTTYIMDDENGCVNVCANSIVTYKVHGQLIGGLYFWNKYDWNVVGGVFLPGNTTSLQGGFYQGNPYVTPNLNEEVSIQWGSVGSGYITVTETSILPCEFPKSKSICINIIESPTSSFTYDDLTMPLAPDDCYFICRNSTVYFKNLSFGSTNSPITSYEWDFGDGSPYSHLENPSHVYDNPGIYSVRLTVRNDCNCTDTYIHEICVDKNEAPHIECPNIVCEGHTGVYLSNSDCSPYTWSVLGGVIQSTNKNQVNVTWNNVGNDGFGFVMLDGSTCNNACPLITKMKVPVIKQIGHIDGPNIVCINQQYLYKLPAWPATNFEWEIINNNTGTVAATYLTNSHEFSILAGASPGNFTIKCSYYNTLITECAGEAEIYVSVLPQPLIDAPKESCINTDVVCNLATNLVPFTPFQAVGYTNFTIHKPDGSMAYATTSYNANTITLSSSIFNMPGSYLIYASNTLSFCDPDPVTVKVLDIPPAPIAIYGETEVCLTDPYSYSADYLHGTSIKWTIVGGYVAGFPNQTTGYGLNISIIWTTTGTKTITAQRFWDHLPDCLSNDFTININHIVVTGQITGNANPCEDTKETYQLDTYGVVPEVITWSLLPDNLGSITSGQSTGTIDITWLHLGSQQNCQIRCEVTKCGVTYPLIVYNVTIQGSTTITSITPTGPFCSGDPVNSFQVNTSGAAATSFLWDMGDGYTTTTAGNSLSYTYSNTSNTQSAVYPLTVIAISTCNSNPSAPFTTNITVDPEPNASISPAGNVLFCQPMGSYPLTISNTSTGSFSIQWYFVEYGTQNPKAISGANGSTYTVTSTLPNVSPAANTSQGTYYAIVTNTSSGCTKTTNSVTISEDPNCGGSGAGCTPLAPAGISNLSVSLTDCATIQASCSTAGTIGVNIISFTWTVMAGGMPYTQTGTATQNLSPEYTFSQPGQYYIKLDVLYENDDPNEPPCLVTKIRSFIIPMVADIRWGIKCNGNNNGYNLIVNDNTTVYPGYPVTQRQWLLNGTPQACTNATCTFAVTTSASYTLGLIVQNGTLFPCTTSVNITVPNLPTADFTMTTTHPTSNSETCEGREVEFTNTSTPVADILSTVWEFDPGLSEKSYLFHTAFSYTYNPLKYTFQPSLTVTNNYGCTHTKSAGITVYNNTIAPLSTSPNMQYTPSTYDICQGSTTASVFTPLFSGGNGTLSYLWYSGATPLPNFTASTLDITSAAQIGTGTYWVKITDVHNCYQEINPTPAKLSIIYAPTAIIDGKQDACLNDNIELKAISGFKESDVTYYWTCTDPYSQTLAYTTREINIPAYHPGIYTFVLTVTSNVAQCSSTSYPFEVAVHGLPAPPATSYNVLDCDKYEIELIASSAITPTPIYNWSNGASGSNITVSHGGAYRVWLTDKYSCKSHADMDIPLAPDTWFWRFPQDGCYKFCPEDLARWIHGPDYVVFENWAWYVDGNPVNNNAPGSGSGSTSTCDPLRIDLPGDGEGPGNYIWELDNGLCMQQTRPMNWSLIECCHVDIDVENVECIEFNTYSIVLNAHINTIHCPNPSYNISVIDPNTGLAIGWFSAVFPQTLQQGGNSINGTFHLLYYVPTVKIKITVFCGTQERCFGEIEIGIPDCSQLRKGKETDPQEYGPDQGLSSELNVFPNPSSTQTSIVYRLTSEKITPGTMLRILDPSGRVIETIPLSQTSGTQLYDTGLLKMGIYFVELIENNRRVLTRRMMILR